MECQKCKVRMDKGIFENSSWAQLSDETDRNFSPYTHKFAKTFIGKLGLFKGWYMMMKLKSPEFVYAYRCPKCKEVVFYSDKE